MSRKHKKTPVPIPAAPVQPAAPFFPLEHWAAEAVKRGAWWLDLTRKAVRT
jgi:hypothetical protein